MARLSGIERAVALGALLSALGFTACGSGSNSGGTGPTGPEDPPTTSECALGEFESTFDAIQVGIFERQGCTESKCHGNAQSGGLDLRTDGAWQNLFDQKSSTSAFPRVRPGEPTQSYLYLKLAASTEPGSVEIAGSPMPIGLPAISRDQLEALRIWIEAGAPRTGSVGDSIRGDSEYVEKLLGACLPPATPISIEPLEAPVPDEGFQLRMPPYVLPARTEREVCVAQYYDLSDVVPEEYQDRARGVVFVNGSHMRQDPHSHHLVIKHAGLGAESVHDPSFGAWTCKGGPRAGEVCEPTDLASCGGPGLCASALADSVACIGYGPEDAAINVAGGSIGGAQTSQQIMPPRSDGIYSEIPVRGILYWNSHAFNLTGEDHTLNARMNLSFSRDLQVKSQDITDIHDIYVAAGQAPFTKRRYCARHTLPQGADLLGLSSHTHKRGEHFTVDLADGARIYESFLYSDPVDAFYEPPLRFDSPDASQRTLTYCVDFNNGLTEDGGFDLRRVTRASTMPARTSCRPVACAAGRIGEPCAGASDDATCDVSPGSGDGLCDACPITAGVTTENEMFVLTGNFAVRPR